MWRTRTTVQPNADRRTFYVHILAKRCETHEKRESVHDSSLFDARTKRKMENAKPRLGGKMASRLTSRLRGDARTPKRTKHPEVRDGKQKEAEVLPDVRSHHVLIAICLFMKRGCFSVVIETNTITFSKQFDAE